MSINMYTRDPEDHEYTYINEAGPVREDSHRYEVIKGQRRSVHREPVQMTLPEAAKPSNTCCRRPPCWAWVILVIALVIAATLIALFVYFFTSTPKDDAVKTSIIGGSTLPSTNALIFTDCEDAYKKGQRSSGVYMISPTGQGLMTVQCDHQLDGGGWTNWKIMCSGSDIPMVYVFSYTSPFEGKTQQGGTPKVIQRRINGAVSFDRNWASYKDGFGVAAAEYWLGNENIHVLTSGRGQKLKIEMTHPNTTIAYADFSVFWIDGEDQKYTLHVAGWKPSYPPEDALSEHNGQGFSTLDRDNDGYDDENCGMYVPGGWWFRNCHPSNLNGNYEQGVTWDGIIWVPFTESKQSLINVRMMIKKA